MRKNKVGNHSHVPRAVLARRASRCFLSGAGPCSSTCTDRARCRPAGTGRTPSWVVRASGLAMRIGRTLSRQQFSTTHYSARGRGGRTVLHSANAPHGARDEHADGHHAEYLDAAAAHVEHDGVHRQRLGRRVGQFPRLGHLERRRIRRRGRSRGRGFLGRLSAHRGRVDIPRRVGHVRRFRPAHSSPVRHAGAGGRGQGAEGRGGKGLLGYSGRRVAQRRK